MSFLGWGKTQEESNNRPVTRSGQLTEEARELATARAEERKKKKEEKRLKHQLENLSPSETDESGESSIEDYLNTHDRSWHRTIKKMARMEKEPRKTCSISGWNVTRRKLKYGSRC